MAVLVSMPKFGLTMHEGTVQRFFVAKGDKVSAGQPLYEVETEKVLYEVEAPATGVLAAILCAEGETVECGVAVAVIAEPNEKAAEIAQKYAKAGGGGPSAATETNAPTAPARREIRGKGRRPATPVARKLAAELSVSLDEVAGSGPGGRITRHDVELAAASPRTHESKSEGTRSASAETPTFAPILMRGMRKAIADRMYSSLRDTAQITIMTEADVTPATELRARLKQRYSFSFTDLIVHAAARALLHHPRLFARLEADRIVSQPTVNIGIAVALEEGLIVPVIQDAAHKTLKEIASESKSLRQKARAGQLKLEDVSGGNFTVTNLGAWGIDGFTPILNPGQTAILGVGRIVEKPAIHNGEVARRAMITLSLTFDHRLIDGAPAADFLQSVVEIFNYGDR